MQFSTILKNNYDFRRIYARGKSAVSGHIVLYFRRNKSSSNRLGITVSAKLGCAVRRNRVRRRLREIYRLNEHLLAPGYDIIIVVRGRGITAPYRTLEADFLRLAEKLELIQ